MTSQPINSNDAKYDFVTVETMNPTRSCLPITNTQTET